MVQRENEDEAWRAIVDNYGDRPDLTPDPGAPVLDPEDRTTEDTEPEPDPVQDVPPAPFRAPLEDPEDRFVPPEPPPVPRPSRDRYVAWLGVIASPAFLLVSQFIGLQLPQLINAVLVTSFVFGFLYLVWQMPRGPRDPWDDGAKV